MNEFDIEAWQRELDAWRRRLSRQPPGALTSLLCTVAGRLESARAGGDERHLTALEDGFAELRALYDRLLGGGDSLTIPA